MKRVSIDLNENIIQEYELIEQNGRRYRNQRLEVFKDQLTSSRLICFSQYEYVVFVRVPLPKIDPNIKI